jgi:hypothetical protein
LGNVGSRYRKNSKKKKKKKKYEVELPLGETRGEVGVNISCQGEKFETGSLHKGESLTLGSLQKQSDKPARVSRHACQAISDCWW